MKLLVADFGAIPWTRKIKCPAIVKAWNGLFLLIILESFAHFPEAHVGIPHGPAVIEQARLAFLTGLACAHFTNSASVSV